jgi:hypothetical protein
MPSLLPRLEDGGVSLGSRTDARNGFVGRGKEMLGLMGPLRNNLGSGVGKPIGL